LIGSADPGWDPLAYAIQEAHKYGLEFHAYINTHPCWQSASHPPPPITTPIYPYYEHCDTATGKVDWLIANESGTPVQYEESNYVWCSPGVPDFCTWVRRQVLYVVENYDVDGVHFDRVRMPGPQYSHDAISEARRSGAGNPNGYDFPDWMRDQTTRMINDIYGAIQLVKPWVKVSAAPLGLYRQDRYPGYPSGFQYGYSVAYQDAQAMIALGAVDFLVPMIYWANGGSKPDFNDVLPDWIQHNAGRFIASGQITSMGTNEIINNIQFMRAQGGQGNVIFSYSSAQSTLNSYRDTVYTSKVPVPEMPWKTNPTEGTIAGFVYDEFNNPVVDAKLNRSGSSYNWLSSADGFYAMLKVPLNDTYTITASKAGVGSATLTNVSFPEGSSVLRLDIKLSAQPSPTPAPTETPMPTETPTPLPTDTPTPVPTETPSPTPTPAPLHYTFDTNEEGWQFAGRISPFDQPQSQWQTGRLGLSPQGSANSFSFWFSLPVEVQNKLYRAQWTVGSSA
ncbi:MAG: family 10 glycosylhydrolase, partial [Candidatus Sumerlaeia bacterium]|nr:family 10 glycosylhydrolase [Candidatus Sumerlaeia bacterium]